MHTTRTALAHYGAKLRQIQDMPADFEEVGLDIDWDDPTEWDVPSNDYFERGGC